MKKVQVLLSSYNGKKYMRQQLDSILNQKGVEVNCLVRDDGSTDGTLDILFEYNERFDNLEIVVGENIGYKASFMQLVYISGEYDYYAFADQDDVWKNDKLLKAVEQLAKLEENSAMYYSNCTVVDNNLSYVNMLHTVDEKTPCSKIQALVQGFVHGCTMVFNYKARTLIVRYKTEQEYAHDFWIPLIMLFVGNITYDNNSYILYRQHSSNVFGSRNSINTILLHSLRKIENRNFYSNLVQDLLNGYGDLIEAKDQIMLREMMDYKNSFLKKIKLLLNNQLRRNTLRGTILLKTLVLFSRY